MLLVDDAGNEWDLEQATELPEYVKDSLRAWCAADRARQAGGTPHRSELEELGRSADYDPEADWLDEPFPEEYL